MDDLMDMIVSDEASASDISDKIKEILYAKALTGTSKIIYETP